MLSNLRIIHPPCSDNPTNLSVLLLCVDAQRYLFNAPEGTIRSLIQQGGMSHVKAANNVFLPRVGVKECGGLPGLIMSMADVGGRQLVIHGPPVMTHYLASCRAYLRRESIRIQVREATIHESSTSNAEGSTDDRIAYQDENITVQAIPLLPTGFTLPSQDHSASPSRPPKRRRSAEILWAPTPESSQCVNIMFPNDVDKPALEADEEQAENMAKQDTALRLKLRERANANFRGIGSPPLQPVAVSDTSSLNMDYTKEQGPVLVYIVRGKDVAGKVDAAKAQLMGVPMGRHLRTLKEGKDIEITRPKDWTSYSAKERSTWASYSAMKESAAVLKAKGRPAAKKKRSEEQIEMENKLDQVETEQVIIKSADVVGESKAGFLFAQIYLPSTRYLDSFLADSMQSQLQFQATKPHTIVHAVHHEVLRDERYQGFIQSLKDTHHIIVSRPFLPDRLAYPSSALADLRMGYLDKALFPPPKYTLEPHLKLSDVGLKGDNVHLSELDTNIKLYPPAPPSLFDQSALNLDHSLDSQKVKRLITYEEGSGRKAVTEKDMEARRAAWKVYVEKAQSLSKSTAANGFTEDKDLWPLKLTTLGTGSALPNKHRNVSGALVHLPGKDAGYILLDAGESTYSQLTRKFGDRGVDDVVANIRLVFLSHIHADHHMGVTRILAERAKLRVKRPLFVVAPSFVRKYLEEANQIQSLGISNDDIEANGVIMLNSEHLDSKRGVEVDSIAHPGQDTQGDKSRLWQEGLKAESVELLRKQGLTFTDETLVSETTAKLYSRSSGERTRTQALRKHLTQLLHGTQVYTAEVDHRVSHCYGIVLRGNGWSGAYSGDTRPCKNLIEAGRGVDFLLHEATMEDELGAMAHMKGHSTFGQAIDVAKQMGAKYVILTHFSQRYAKMPKLNLRSDLGDLKVGIAFDLLTMQMSDVDKLMGYRETLELMYAVDQEEEDDTIPGETEGDLVMDGTEKPAVETSLNGAEEVAMEVDGPKSEAEVSTSEQEQASKNGGREDGHRRFQRKFVKSHEYQYVSVELRPTLSRTRIAEMSTPSRLIIAKAVETSLIDLNGIVNGSFNWDLLDVKPIPSKNVIRVVIKAPTSHLETLRASISAGLLVQLDGHSFQARYDRTFSALDLVALETDNSQQWFDDVVKQANQRHGQQ